MEHVPSSLNLLIREQRKLKTPFPERTRKVLAFQLFKALYYMQLTRVCHRDLKPPNILVNPQTLELKVCDFGSAKILEKEESNVSYICSRYYRAPELVMNATDYSTEIDVWSAGCILIELLTLEPIFPGDSSQEQLIEIIKILGTPPQKYLELYEAEKNMSYKLPDIKPNNWEVVLRKYKPEETLVDFLGRILTYDAKGRLTPFEGLTHPYFSDLPSYSEELERLPALLQFGDLHNYRNSKEVDILQRMFPQPEPELHEKKPLSLPEAAKKERTPNTNHE
jgi:serine/threonine protein kinase